MTPPETAAMRPSQFPPSPTLQRIAAVVFQLSPRMPSGGVRRRRSCQLLKLFVRNIRQSKRATRLHEVGECARAQAHLPQTSTLATRARDAKVKSAQPQLRRAVPWNPSYSVPQSRRRAATPVPQLHNRWQTCAKACWTKMGCTRAMMTHFGREQLQYSVRVLYLRMMSASTFLMTVSIHVWNVDLW